MQDQRELGNTAKMNSVDPQAWLTDVLVRIAAATASNKQRPHANLAQCCADVAALGDINKRPVIHFWSYKLDKTHASMISKLCKIRRLDGSPDG